MLINAMARAPFVLVQSYGYAKWTALLHLSELPVYAGCLWLLIGYAGLNGVAYAWTGRAVVDTVAVHLMASRLDPRLWRSGLRNAGAVVFVIAISLILEEVVRQRLYELCVVTVVVCGCGTVLLRDVRSSLATSNPSTGALQTRL
jgi:hypothetical protein